MHPRKKLWDQIPYPNVADIVPYYMQLIDDLFQDFIDEVNRQQTETKQQNRTINTIIKNVDDVVRLIKLQLNLMYYLPTKYNVKREAEERLNDTAKSAPEAQDKITKILEDFLNSVKPKKKIDGGGQ